MDKENARPILDATDRRMLALLQRDGRISVVDLAEQVSLSPTPCLRRLKRMEQSGVITGYAAQVNPSSVGKGLQAFVQVTLESHAEEVVEAFRAALLARPEVVACYATSGDMDFLLHVIADDLESYSDFALKALLRMPGVKGTRSNFVMEMLKRPTGVPLDA